MSQPQKSFLFTNLKVDRPLSLNDKIRKLHQINSVVNDPNNRELVSKPFCPTCKVRLVPTSIKKYYGYISNHCALCSTEIGPYVKIYACANVDEQHKPYHVCRDCV